jgi:uncharacterized protein (TIGR02680 family)
MSDRFRLTRGGILNVWQYDNQVFDFGGGRLLLRGTNGAGKSKTLEMLLPFVIDGDKSRITASGRHHTSLLWLMLDGYSGQSRTGYLWLEFQRPLDEGGTETVTCGIGLRASESARAATAWFFTSPRRVGIDLHLTDPNGPLTMQRLRAEVESDGHFFDNNGTRRYREHVGQLLFGLPLDQYEDLLRLLYWLRQPQVGEDIDPRRLAEQLVQALPQVDEAAIRTAGDTFDQLEEFGEQIDRQERSAAAISTFLETYRSHARGVVEARATAVVEAEEAERRCRRAVRRVERSRDEAATQLDEARARHREADSAHAEAVARIGQLMAGPEARAQQRLLELDAHRRTKQDVADQARARADRQQARHELERGRAEMASAALAAAATAWVEAARHVRSRCGEAGLSGLLSRSAQVTVAGIDWHQDEPSHALRGELRSVAEEAGEVHEHVGVARAAVKVVEQARLEADQRRAEADRREEASAAKEAAVERRAARLDEQATAARRLGDALAADLATWQADPAAIPVELPELSAQTLAGLEGLVAEAVAPVRSSLERDRAVAAATRQEAERRREVLRDERAVVAAETDPSPPSPSWDRDDRGGREGAPLWRLVDFRDEVDDAERAAIEAALEGSGLLDAWVTPDGHVLGTVADAFATDGGVDASTPRVPAPSRHLGEVLRVDAAGGSGVDAAVVTAVLERVGLRGAIDDDAGEADRDGLWIGLDGGWSSGVLVGRTRKAAAQYVGATARAAERLRRLAAIDGAIAALEPVIEAAAAKVAAHTESLALLDAWSRARPPHDALLRAWAAEHEAGLALDEARAEHAAARREAESARSEAASAHGALVSLGQVHSLPTTADGLAARDAVLVEVLSTTRELETGHAALLRDLDQWDVQAERARSELETLEETTSESEQAHAAAQQAAAELEELRRAAGASVEELERRLEALGSERDHAGAERDEQGARIETLLGDVATLTADLSGAQERLVAAIPVLDQARTALTSLEKAPGLIVAALGPEPGDATTKAAEDATTKAAEDATAEAAEDATGGDAAEPIEVESDTHDSSTRREGDSASAVVQLGAGASPATYGHGMVWTPLDPRALLAAVPAGRRADDTAVVAASQVLIASAAANLEPRITQVEGAWVALGLGDGGEAPLVDLEAQLVATVRANKDLLSQRERQIFEEQVLGYLGDSLRGVRLKAAELVTAMNTQLEGVTTSQGIRVRLRWRLRDDIPADAKRAVELLGQPVGALLPGERVELRESLHRLIGASRDEAPEDSYAEHLARALDYRRWFGFSVQYHRPETGEWRDLQRKSALSQGEQKVLCYLPLFAAAAAHFTSVAGAAPHAPRVVLLDDAFPKIDARTHPLLFGLLVDLDLDFVVTSERLWGTHSTVPELAIYEALRSPGERGIAQFEHRWDGQQLTSVGAGALGGGDDSGGEANG